MYSLTIKFKTIEELLTFVDRNDRATVTYVDKPEADIVGGSPAGPSKEYPAPSCEELADDIKKLVMANTKRLGPVLQQATGGVRLTELVASGATTKLQETLTAVTTASEGGD